MKYIIRFIAIVAMFVFMMFATNDAIAHEIEQIEINFDYYEYKNVRDSTNNYFNLRVTYDMCEIINDDELSTYLCKSFAYERAITIDA